MKAGWRIRRLTDGSAILTRRLGAAFVPHHPDGEIRLLAATVRIATGAYTATKFLGLAHHTPWWMAAGTCLWCTAAWRAQPDQAEPQAADVTAEHTRTDTEIYEGIVDYLTRLIGNRNGVHLTEALRGLQQQGLLPADLTAAEFGRQLQRRGIPVRASLKVAGQVGPGVHRDDLPAAEQPLPAPPSMAAG